MLIALQMLVLHVQCIYARRSPHVLLLWKDMVYSLWLGVLCCLEIVTALQLASEDMPVGVPLFLDTRLPHKKATQTVEFVEALGLRAVGCVHRIAQPCAVFTKGYDQYRKSVV